MLSDSVWIVGPSRSGKTENLVKQFCTWMQNEIDERKQFYTRRQVRHVGDRLSQSLNIQREPAVLVLAANDDNRRELADRIVAATGGKYPVRSKTPLGFCQDEVILFWPLLIQQLNLKAQFPVRLRPETEQELATQLWRTHFDAEIVRPVGVSEYRLVRRILDLLQLAAYSGTPTEEVSSVLQGLVDEGIQNGVIEPRLLASLLLQWRNWCLERGLLTYGIITELYGQHLLPDPNYQRHLNHRYRFVLADDVDDYPGVARSLFEFLLDQGAVGAFTYNPDGGVRLGLGADPNYLAGLAKRCKVKTLTQKQDSLADTLGLPIVESVIEPMVLLPLPEAVQSVQTTSRGELLRQTAEVIIKAVQSGQVQPQEVAVIAPGLDAIARYTLVEILTKQGIAVESLNDQRPLTSSPVIRALLTLLALVYPGLGRLVDRDAVAEMLVVLSQKTGERSLGTLVPAVEHPGVQETGEASPLPTPYIDPVRAGLLADFCFEPHPDRPNLLPVTAYDRWDRLGYAATTAYSQIVQWLEMQRSQQEQRLLPSPISLLDRAIQRFLWNGSNLPYNQLAALRELLETAQHYWEVDTRLRHKRSQEAGEDAPLHATIADFIQLLRRGTITANPYPVRPIGAASRAVTLATIFQYRSSRRFHRWQFWLDAGSPLWLSGGAATLFGAPLFLQHRFGQPWTTEDATHADQERLRRILLDLLGRVGERVYLCHSDLAVNGQEQLGPLLPLINASVPLVFEPATSLESLEPTR